MPLRFSAWCSGYRVYLGQENPAAWRFVFLIGLYALYIVSIWLVEQRHPALGETGVNWKTRLRWNWSKLRGIHHWVGRDCFNRCGGMILGSIHCSGSSPPKSAKLEATQKPNSVDTSGLCYSLCWLVVLAWSAARQGVQLEVAVASLDLYLQSGYDWLGSGQCPSLTILDFSISLYLWCWVPLALVILLAAFKGSLGKIAEFLVATTLSSSFALLIFNS